MSDEELDAEIVNVVDTPAGPATTFATAEAFIGAFRAAVGEKLGDARPPTRPRA
jgi:hypothetical protein